MYHKCRLVERCEQWNEVEVAQRFPNGLLHSSGDSERGQIARPLRVGEVAGDADFEETLSMGSRIGLLQPRRGQLRAQPGDVASLLSLGELRLESLPMAARERSGVDENQTRRPLELGATLRLERIQEREHSAPGIPHDRERSKPELSYDQGEIIDLRSPGDGGRVIGPGPSTTALIVEEQLVVFGEGEHLGEEILVMRARATVQDQQTCRRLGAVGAPVQWDRGRGSNPVTSGGREGLRHAAKLREGTYSDRRSLFGVS